MGREDEVTIMRTSIAKIFARLIDEYIKEEEKKPRLLSRKKLSRTAVLEDAILLLLAQKGVLEQRLRALEVTDAEVQDIIKHLEAEYGVPAPKAEQTEG